MKIEIKSFEFHFPRELNGSNENSITVEVQNYISSSVAKTTTLCGYLHLHTSDLGSICWFRRTVQVVRYRVGVSPSQAYSDEADKRQKSLRDIEIVFIVLSYIPCLFRTLIFLYSVNLKPFT